MKNMLPNSNEYISLISEIKTRIRSAQHRAVLGANRELILLYWNIGKTILQQAQWGNKFVENLSHDIKLEFPSSTGYSIRNLKYMRKFAELFADEQIVQASLAQLTWYHHQTLMDKASDTAHYLWYAEKNIENGWSRNVLVHQIESNLFARQAATSKATNFTKLLPSSMSELALGILKDPYVFDFIDVREDMQEADVERELVSNITKFLLELGNGFAFMGSQYHIQVSERDYYIDLLFYHTVLSCYFVFELKIGEFKPEYVGKLNFYVNAVDKSLKKDGNSPTIGILLCKDKDVKLVECSLDGISTPIGVSEYRLAPTLPEEIVAELQGLQGFLNIKSKSHKKTRS